jgi:predicted AAA+ superfamily ATPase
MLDAESEKKIVSLLTNRFNKWWSNQILEVPPFRRRDFRYLITKLDEPRAITLVGPRQVGKTTVVMQLIKELIETKKIPPKRILYVQFDDVELRILCKGNVLVEILSVYQKYILSEDLNTAAENVYLFFDEVQRVKNWAEHVKALLAANPRIHVLSTGSSSFKISQKSKETLPGRHELFEMFPLKFADAMALGQPKTGRIDLEQMKAASYGLRAKFEEALGKKSFKEFFTYCKSVYVQTAPFEADIRASLLSYLSKGGYPAIVRTEDVPTCQKLLQSYANDIIVKDLMPWFNIRDFDSAEKLMFLLASISGEQLNVSGVLKRLSDSNAITVRKYIGYFRSVGIIGVLPRYSGSKLGSPKHPKLYFLDAGFRNALLGILDAPMPDTEKGHLAETVAYDHILRLAYKLNASTPGHVSFFLSKKGEVDFIMDLPRHSFKLPIEIKFRESVGKLAGLEEFVSEYAETKLAIVVTADELELKGEMLLMPMWMFLLMC